MKKFKGILALVLVLALLAGCGANPAPTTAAPTEAPTTAAATEAPTTEAPTTAAATETTTAPDLLASATANVEGKDIRIITLKGPTGMGMAALMERNEQEKTKNHYSFELAGAPEDVVAKVIKNEVDIAAVPANLASVLYNKTEGKIQLLAVNTLGVLYVLENGEEIKEIGDLAGKTMVSTGKGAMPEYVLGHVLAQNNLTDVTIDYKAEHSELAAAMTSGDVKLALLPEPFVTAVLMKNKDVRVALNVTEEWGKVNDGAPLTTGVVIVQKEFAEQNKEAVLAFLAEYAKSVQVVTGNPEVGGALIEKHGIMPKAAVAQAAIPRASMVMIPAWEARPAVEKVLTILHEGNPKSVGGKLPDEGFFFNAD